MLYLLRFFAVTFLILFLLGFIARILFRQAFKKMSQKYGQQGQQPPRPEGEVSVNQSQHQKKKVSKDVGEYVDFEEVKNKK
ncbi:MAG TPA: hypothetical protein PL017_03380 [Tenuifilaceae bacterium]|nr:hypothetical protein [Tenuifilaceae bacterium]HPE18893.1 hypothetical protein [Tenuifilaceae bacterium]HPJ45114.1 hypothetical protein [Tenuifilaceae bacterium]HPQ33714.1 hypothetical protein [Tenuifilaceae bacterium]HRX68065.1 hypothetical protein [Tenuifilaceae bacterium]